MATHPVPVRYDEPKTPAGIATVLPVDSHRETGPQSLVLSPDAGDQVASSKVSTTDQVEPRRTSGSPAPSWPEPDFSLLDTRRGDLPVLPSQLLPGFWRRWAEDAAHEASAPVDHVAMSLITVAASLVGSSRLVTPRSNWAEPCILWAVLIGSRSSGKTPAADASLRLIECLEEDLTAVNRAEWQSYRDAVARSGRDAKAVRGAAGKRPSRPPPFVPRRLLTGETSVPFLAELMGGTAFGVLLARDQQSGWLDALACDRTKAHDRSFWLSAWSAAPWCLADEASSCDELAQATTIHPAVSLLTTIRPEALAQLLAGDDDHDGLMGRFLFTWPQRAPFRQLADIVPADSKAAYQALARLRDMLDDSRELPLAPEALAAFDVFRRMHHAAGEPDGREAGWWGKGPGTVLRLAGVLTFLDWAAGPRDAAEPDCVPGWAIAAASGLWRDYLWPHAQAAFRTAGSGVGECQAERVLRWIRRQRLSEISRTSLRRKALGLTCGAAETQRIAESLAMAGWLRPLDVVSSGAGRPPLRWAVNPALHETPAG
jgi:hypothetical protein